MKIPERVVQHAWLAYCSHPRTHDVGAGQAAMQAAITAALQEWIASGEAMHGGGYLYGNGKLVEASTSLSGVVSEAPYFPVLIIRMEPDND